MSKYSSWPTTDEGNVIGGRLKVEVRNRFSSMSSLSAVGQRDAALTELLAGTSEVYNVKSYGAKGDGVTDDTAAFQAALDAADTAGSGAGLVYVPGGVWVLDGITIGSQVTLAGGGWGSILFHKAASANPLITTSVPSTTTHVCIRNLLIDGNSDNQTTAVNAIDLDSTSMSTGKIVRHRLYDLYIRSVKGHGLVTDSPGRQTFVDNVNCHNIDKVAFRLSGVESHFVNCNSGSSGEQGFFLLGHTNSLVSCRVGEAGRLDDTNGDGYLIKNSTRNLLSNCISDSNQGHGFYSWGQSGTMEGSVYENCTSTNDNQKAGASNDGFRFLDTTRAQGFGCKVTTTDGPGVIYGVNFASGSQGNRIYITSQGHQTGLTQSTDTNNIVNGLGSESASAETPTAPVFDTIDAGAAVDKGDGTVGIPVTGHAFISGTDVTISGTTNYNGVKLLDSVSTNEIVITATYVAETFATSDRVQSGFWEPGDIVDHTDSGDGSGDGIYLLLQDAATWRRITVDNVATFSASDTTPTVRLGQTFLTHASPQTLTDFDNGVAGQRITVISKAAVTFAFSGNLTGSSASLVTASGDVTEWICEDGTVWILTGYVDVSVDNSAGA